MTRPSIGQSCKVVSATLMPPPVLEGGRVGLGPYFMLVLPIVFVALWNARRTIFQSPLFPVGVLIAVHYALWIELGQVSKIRHILPLIPALILCMGVAAASKYARLSWRPAALIILFSLGINFGAHGLFAREYIRHALTGDSADEFLARNVFAYSVAQAINARPEIKGVLIWNRQLRFHIKTKVFFIAPNSQTMIDTRRGKILPHNLVRQMTAEGLTHIAVSRAIRTPDPGTLWDAIAKLQAINCITLEERVPYRQFASRTLKSLWQISVTINIWRIDPGCG